MIKHYISAIKILVIIKVSAMRIQVTHFPVLNNSIIILANLYSIKLCSVCFREKVNKFPLTAMGVLAPGSGHARPSAQPPMDVSENFPAHVSAELP